MVHLSRDRFCVTIRSSNAAAAPAAEASVPPLGGSIRFLQRLNDFKHLL
jgi:hypothetical protein